MWRKKYLNHWVIVTITVLILLSLDNCILKEKSYSNSIIKC